MNAEHLVKMANQIATYYEAYSDRAAAEHDYAQHIRRFWDPRMRREFFEQIELDGGAHLRPFVREAVAAHGDELREGTTGDLARMGAKPVA